MTSNKAISVEAKVWRKIEHEAVMENLVPALALRLKDNVGRDIDLVVISLDEFAERFNGTE